jgi:S-layer like family, N-terminal region.
MNNRVKKLLYIAGSISLLGMSAIATASQISFNSVPIIGSNGAPVVQIVVGNNAKISDGIVAANIATIIGQLSFAQKQVSLMYNVSLPSIVQNVVPKVTVSNVSVYLGESGVTGTSSSSVLFNTVIGSIINQAVLQNPGSAIYTKSLQTNDAYTFPETSSINSVPQQSPYTFIGVPINQSVSAGYNGGGVSFSRFSAYSNGGTYDNILNVNMPGLLSNSGPASETESLWLTGITAFNQHDNALELENGNMAYKVTFGNPINILTNGQTTHEKFSFLGNDYITYNSHLQLALFSQDKL